jgi:Tfp pilus assembly protein PilN
MRPVNLIPPEDRRGDRAPLRSGPLSYIVIGALGLVLLAVTMLVTTSNDISDKQAQVDQLEAERDAAAADAAKLTAYTEFASLREQREATVASLAQSRFDWERVMRELALVIPSDVTLTNLNGSATGNAEGSTATTDIVAPNLSLTGCAADHEAVARFVASLEDIDGVTRVGLTRDETADQDSGESSTLGDSSLCGSANTFDVAVAFDGAVVSAAAAAAAAPTAPATPAEPVPTSSEVDPGTAEGEASRQQQTEKSKKAANLIPGVAAP